MVYVGRPNPLDHVVVIYILNWDKRKSQINEYSDRQKNEIER